VNLQSVERIAEASSKLRHDLERGMDQHLFEHLDDLDMALRRGTEDDAVAARAVEEGLLKGRDIL
jgi:hypothetical protein